VSAPEFVKALVLLNRHHVIKGLLRDLLLLDGHLDLELGLHFLALHANADSDNVLFGELAFITASSMIALGLSDTLVHFLNLLLDGLLDLGVTTLLEALLGSLELLGRASSFLEDIHLECLHVGLLFRLAHLDHILVSFHVSCLHELAAMARNGLFELPH